MQPGLFDSSRWNNFYTSFQGYSPFQVCHGIFSGLVATFRAATAAAVLAMFLGLLICLLRLAKSSVGASANHNHVVTNFPASKENDLRRYPAPGIARINRATCAGSSIWTKVEHLQDAHWKEPMEALGDASIQVRICIAKNDPDRPSELPQLREHFCA